MLFVAAPLFLRMPLTNDTLLYDLQTRLFTEGAVPYRDILEPNWPGVFWIHSAIRGVFGRSSEAMRAFDQQNSFLLMQKTEFLPATSG